MPSPRLDPALAQEALDAWSKYGSWQQAAHHLNLPKSTIQARIERAKQLGLKPRGVPFEPVRHPIGFEIDPAAYRPSSGSGRAKPRKARCRRGKK